MSRRLHYGLFILIFSSTAFAAKLDSLVIQKQGNKTTARLIIAGSVTPKLFTLKNPERVVIDLNNTTTTIDVNTIVAIDGLITRVRRGYPNAQTLRLVFDVKQHVHIKMIPMRTGLVVDFIEKKSMQKMTNHLVNSPVKLLIPAHVKPPLAAPINPSLVIGLKSLINAKTKPITVHNSPSRSLRDVVIVLDPGHGGKDPGAIGPRRNAEKNVVLAIALKLKQIINKQPGMRAVLTREKDHYVGLRERLNIARKHNGDIFISIHADAFINKHSNGASVFALSQRGATSEAARWLAEKENTSELGGVNLADLDDQNGLIRTVLLDLSQTATIGASVQMGTLVLKSLDNITNLHNVSVEQARFVVLKSPDMPSILIETGFISNPREEQNLTSSTYQTKLTMAIFNGIKRYFWEYPPPGTRVEAMASHNFHLAKAGELAPIIAAHNQVALADLQALHHPHTSVNSGQKFNIPTS